MMIKRQTKQISRKSFALNGWRYSVFIKLLATSATLLPMQLFAHISDANNINFGFIRGCTMELRWDEATSSIVDIRTTSSGDVFGQMVAVSLPSTPIVVEESLVRVKLQGSYLTLPYSEILLPKRLGGAPGIVVYGLKLDSPLELVRKKLSNSWGGRFTKITKNGATYLEFRTNSNSAQNQSLMAKPRISVDHDKPSKTYLICDYSF